MKKSYKKGFKIIAKNKTFSVPMSRYLRKLFEDNFPNNKMSSRYVCEFFLFVNLFLKEKDGIRSY